MKILLTFLLFVGISSSKFLESKDPVSNRNWDDDDSMTLPSTTSKSEFLDNIQTQTEPKFISLIPKENENSEGSQFQYEYSSGQSQPRPESGASEDQDESVTPTTQENSSESESDSSTNEDDNKELPKTHLMQLGKIPLKLKVVPLLPPVRDHLLGSRDEKPVDFSENSGATTPSDTVESTPREDDTSQQQQQQSGEEQVSDDVVRVRNNVPEPLPYLTPPKMDDPDYWRRYPVLAEGQHTEDLGKTLYETDGESHYTPDSIGINPILERLNDFLQKAKRHSMEQEQAESPMEPRVDPISEEDQFGETSTKETNENGEPIHIHNDSDEVISALQSSTTESIENTDVFSQSPELPMMPMHDPDQIGTTPRSEIPDLLDYQPAPQPFPYRTTLLNPTSINQIAPSYYNTRREAIIPYLYANAMPTTMSPPLRRSYQYIPDDSYWPRKYFYDGVFNDGMTSSFPRYYFNDYYRQQRNNFMIPSSSMMNSIQEERPFTPSTAFPYAYADQLYGNAIPTRRSSFDLESLYYPNSYMMNRRSFLPYRSYYSSPIVNDMMYAPQYSYQQYRTAPPQQLF